MKRNIDDVSMVRKKIRGKKGNYAHSVVFSIVKTTNSSTKYIVPCIL